MSTTFSGYKRRKADDYPTPVEAVNVLFDSHDLPYSVRDAWDPCCGKRRRILEAVRNYGYKARGTDIIFGRDFLTTQFGQSKMDIVTNPPFGVQGRLAVAFIERALELTLRYRRRVFMLLPVDFDSGSTRQAIFGGCPRFAHKVVLLNRVRIFNNQSGTTNHAWFVWDGSPRERWKLPTISYARIHYEKGASR